MMMATQFSSPSSSSSSRSSYPVKSPTNKGETARNPWVRARVGALRAGRDVLRAAVRTRDDARLRGAIEQNAHHWFKGRESYLAEAVLASIHEEVALATQDIARLREEGAARERRWWRRVHRRCEHRAAGQRDHRLWRGAHGDAAR